MLADDTPEYPMTYSLAFDFRGEFDREALERALADTLTHHPLLTARVERVPRKGYCWVGTPSSPVPLDWGMLEAPLEGRAGGAIDLRLEAGLRLWVRQGDGRACLTLLVHHACADGVGTLQFVRDLLVAYSVRAVSDMAAPAPVRLAAEKLRIRDRFDVTLPEPVSPWAIVKSTVTEAAKFFSRRPTPLAVSPESRSLANGAPADAAHVGTKPQRGHHDAARSPRAELAASVSGVPDVCSCTFSAAETTALYAAAARHDATLNDVLLRDAFVVAADWNAAHEPTMRGRWLRINMPINLRMLEHRRMPAANAMSFAFLTRRGSDCTDPQGLLRGIRQETKAIKYWSLGLLFLDGLRFSLRVPGLAKFSTRRRRCLASLVLSNFGDVARYFPASLVTNDRRIQAANVVLESLTGAPPIRPLTRASLLVSRYAGQLIVSVRCDPRCFTAGAARALLARYVKRLQETASDYR